MTTTLLRKVGILSLMMLLLGSVTVIASQIDRVEANDSDYWNINATQGETVTIIVDGDGDTDLDCYVRQGGTSLAQDIDATDYCVLSVRAPRTGRLKLEIENLGDVFNRYDLTIRR